MAVIALSAREASFRIPRQLRERLAGSRLARLPRRRRREEGPGVYGERLLRRPTGHFRGFETIKQPDLRFRVLLTKGGSELKVARAQRKEARAAPAAPRRCACAAATIGCRRSRTKEPLGTSNSASYVSRGLKKTG